MKKFKNKLFYFFCFLIYVIMITVSSVCSYFLLNRSADAFLISNFSAKSNVSFDIAEVIIDDYSIQKYKWPWSRENYIQLLDYFHTYAKPKVIGFDTFLTSFDANNPSDIKFLNQISKMDNLVSGFVPEIVPNNEDEDLLKVFKKKYSLNVDDKKGTIHTAFNGVVNSSFKIIDSTKNYGSLLIKESSSDDNSLFVFSTKNIVKIADSYYPSLPLKMYLLANSTNDVVLNPDNGTIYISKTGLTIPAYYNNEGSIDTDIGFYKNPVDSSSPYSHQSISASRIVDSYKALKSGITPQNRPDLYNPKTGKYVDPAWFNGKTVFIGANVSGPSADVLRTPVSERHSGVDIQATIFDNLVNSYFYTRTGFTTLLLSIILLSLISFIILLRSRFLAGLILIVSVDVIYMVIVCSLAVNGILTSYITPLVCQFVTMIFGYSFKFITENRNKEKIKQAMGKYLSQDIMKNVVKNIDDLKLGGKRAVVTVLFSDIRGFTSLSEKMSAEEVSVILNEYFAEMEPIITKYNGVINKFIGDAVMAIFGEPIQDINHPQNAVKCAYEMLKKVEYLREKWLFEGKPKIEIGIGINTGEVFIGNIGTETRMEYTVIGDTVNLASRIESYNKVYKTNLLVSSSTYSYISDIADVIKISEVQIRGKSKKMNIYEILRLDMNS